jgi:predicted ArsR family transcriptional regulator
MSDSISSRYSARQERVLQALLDAEEPLASDTIAHAVDLPVGGLLVTLRSLQHAGLVRAVPGAHGRPAGWMLTPNAG